MSSATESKGADLDIILAYAALGVMAVIPIYFGSYASVDLKEHEVEEEKEEKDTLSFEDAKMLPVFGSISLFGLYLLFRFFDKEYINYLLTAYFLFVGVGVIITVLSHITESSFQIKLTRDYKIHFSHRDKEVSTIHFGDAHLFFLVISVLLGAVYVLTKHWILSNIYGEALSFTAIQMLHMDSFSTGMMVLAGLFVYDIFWVFGTDVMVTVAKNFNAPIKVLWPRETSKLLSSGLSAWLSNKGIQFTLLGLGDIVVPGIYVALCLRFDYHQYIKSGKAPNGWNFPKPYFIAAFIAYVLGLTATVTVLQIFQAAQPALLYLSPACIFSTLIVGVVKGEISDVFAYTTAKDEKEEKSSDEKTTSEDSEEQGTSSSPESKNAGRTLRKRGRPSKKN